tara:strand:- start:121 stop:336 length:216 start_codon:yes stop_codon:yes gene_type:complete
MRIIFEKYKGQKVNQNGHNFIVAGFNEGHIIGATTKVIEKRTWTDIESGSYVEDAYKEMNFCYIDSTLIEN